MKSTHIFLAFISIILMACSKSETTEGDNEFVIKFIIADEGGTLQTEDGILLDIPPGALNHDTEISLKSLPGSVFDEFGIIGAQVRPDGLEFKTPATIQFPLPHDWDQDELPATYYSEDGNTEDFFLIGASAQITGTQGALKGMIEIDHFSAWGLARNCHAGTIKFLFEDFDKAGCDLTEMTFEVREKWDEKFRVDPYNYNGDPAEFSLGYVPLQCFLDVFFYKDESFTVGENITDVYLQSLKQLMLTKGKQIAVGFSTVWRDENSDGIYDVFDHSAALEIVDGELKLRQSVSVNDRVITKVKAALGDNVIYYPTQGELTADLLNAYREERSGVLVEEAVCGNLNCLFPVPLELRPFPYKSIQFYVSNYASGENPCEPVSSEYTQCYFNLEIGSIMQTTMYFNTGQTSSGQVNGTVFGGTYSGRMEGNIFTGFRDDAPDNTTLNTTITVELDDAREKVMLLHVYYHFEGNFTSERELIMTNIPYDESEASYVVNGPGTCDHIDLFSTTTTYSDRVTTMDSYECIGGELIEVFLFN